MSTAQPLPAAPVTPSREDEERALRVDGRADDRRVAPGLGPRRAGDVEYAGDAVLEDRDVERILIAI